MTNNYSKNELIKNLNKYNLSPFLRGPTNKQQRSQLINNINTLKNNINGNSQEQLKILTQLQEDAQILSIKLKKSKPQESAFFNNMEEYILNYIAAHKKRMHEERNSPEQVQSTVNRLNESDNIAKKKLDDIDGILKTLVNTVGENSPDAMAAQGKLRGLLKKYPNKVPDAIVNLILAKLRENGIGIIFGVQVMSTLLALLIGLIPIPGLAVVSDMIIGGTDAFIDGLVAIGPENVTEFIQNGVNDAIKKAADTFKNDMMPIFKETTMLMGNSLSGVFCCNGKQKQQANNNMDKFGDVLITLIKMVNKGPSGNAQVEQFVNDLQSKVIKTKTINTVDMKALNSLLKKDNPPLNSTPQNKNMPGGRRKKRTKKRKRRRKRKTLKNKK